MNASSTIYAIRWLTRDTFRQALSTRIFWIMLAVTCVFSFFCLSLQISGGVDQREPGDTELYFKGQPVDGPGAVTKVGLLFGALTVETGTRDRVQTVHFIQVMLATMVAGYLGFILIVLWTSGFLPDFLQPANASVLFAKPAPRWTLLVGKYLGVVAFVTFQVGLFFLGTWLALAIRSGVWDIEYLAGIPLLVLNFGVIYSFGVLIAVLTRSTVACVFGCVLFWALCWGMNYGHHWLYAAHEITGGQGQVGPMATMLTQAGYWLLPKPADMEWILQDALQSGDYFVSIAKAPGFQQAIAAGVINKGMSIFTSLLFAIGMLFISSRHLSQTDY